MTPEHAQYNNAIKADAIKSILKGGLIAGGAGLTYGGLVGLKKLLFPSTVPEHELSLSPQEAEIPVPGKKKREKRAYPNISNTESMDFSGNTADDYRRYMAQQSADWQAHLARRRQMREQQGQPASQPTPQPAPQPQPQPQQPAAQTTTSGQAVAPQPQPQPQAQPAPSPRSQFPANQRLANSLTRMGDIQAEQRRLQALQASQARAAVPPTPASQPRPQSPQMSSQQVPQMQPRAVPLPYEIRQTPSQAIPLRQPLPDASSGPDGNQYNERLDFNSPLSGPLANYRGLYGPSLWQNQPTAQYQNPWIQAQPQRRLPYSYGEWNRTQQGTNWGNVANHHQNLQSRMGPLFDFNAWSGSTTQPQNTVATPNINKPGNPFAPNARTPFVGGSMRQKFSSVKAANEDWVQRFVEAVMPTREGDAVPAIFSPQWFQGNAATQKAELPWYAPALGISVLGGGAGGYALAKWLSKKHKKTRQSQELGDANREFEEALLSAHGRSKAAAASLDGVCEELEKQSTDYLAQGTGIYALLAMALAGTAGYGSYKYFKGSDKAKKIQDALKRRAQLRSLASPPSLHLSSSPVASEEEDVELT